MPSDFVEDRMFNYDAPSDESPLREKLEWQRKLEARRMNAELPSDIPHVDFDEKRWWCIPGAISPEQEAQMMQTSIERMRKRVARG
jgi:hypothetical protein